MARAGLTDHPKFRRLVYILKEPIPHVWGYLECLWKAAYQRRSDQIGDAIDVELNAEYPHDPGKLVAALLATGFIDLVGDIYHVHDLADHAPPYVRKSLVCRLGRSEVDSKSTTSRPLVDQESTSSRAEVDQNDEEADFESTTGLQGKGEGRDRDREGKGAQARATSPDSPPPKPSEPPSSWLARVWLFHRRGAHTEHDRQSAANFDDLLSAGVSAEAIEAEIKRPDRPKSEAVWTMCKRLTPRARSPDKPPPLSGTKAFLEQSAKRKAGAT